MPQEPVNNESQENQETQTPKTQTANPETGSASDSEAASPSVAEETVEAEGGQDSLLTGGESEDGSESNTESSPIAQEDLTEILGENADEDLVKEGFDLMQEHGIGKEAGQALAKFMADQQQKAAEATAEAWEAQISKWQEDAKADPDFGGDALNENLAKAKQMVEDYGDDDFKQMLSVLGVGNHPAMIRFILSVGKELPDEGKPVGGAPKAPDRSMADKLFSS